MSLYGIYGEHTIADCPLNKKDNRQIVYKVQEQLKGAAEGIGAKLVAQYHSGLEHTFLWVFESPDAKRLEENDNEIIKSKFIQKRVGAQQIS